MPATNQILEEFNQLDLKTAADTILPCNGSHTWATLVAFNRPFDRPEVLFTISDDAWHSLPVDDWQEAFDSHPRIGEQKAKAATAKSLAWSAGEQSAAALNEDIHTRLADANRAYEAKFGRIFIVCATGKTAAEMLAILQRRLTNDAETELREAAEQQRQITQIRLRKWLGIAA